MAVTRILTHAPEPWRWFCAVLAKPPCKAVLVPVERSLFLFDFRQPLLDILESLPRQGARRCAVLAVYGNDLVGSDFEPWLGVPMELEIAVSSRE